MKITKKSLATATIAATALAGAGFASAPAASADAAATKTFSKSFQQRCNVGPFGPRDLGVTVSGVIPTAVKKGAAFNVTNAKIRVTIPATLNSAAYAAGARSQTVTFSVVNLNNTNIAPAVKDAIATNITTARTAVPANAPSSFLAPKTGGLTVPLKGGANVGTGTLKSGSVSATFQLYNAAGAAIGGPQTVTCGATNIVLTTTKITA